MTNDIEQSRGILAWFVKNHVAANLLMVFVIAAGLLSLSTIKVEFFPEMSLDVITVTVPYRGASPSEVEQGVTLRVEEAVASVDGIKRITSTSAEGASLVVIEVEEYADPSEVLDDVKAEIDRITTFPQETEKPVITEIKTRYEVLTLVLYGDVSERTLKEMADRVKDDLTALPNISQVDIAGVRPYEISVEISEETLRKYNLSFDQVSRAIAGSSLDIPGGSVKTAGGEILARTRGQLYTGPEFERIVVLTRPDGTKIRLGDIATVIDGFDDSDIASRFDGQPAVHVKVFRVGEQDALEVADTVDKYVQEKEPTLPAGLHMAVWQDQSVLLRSRIDLLVRNARSGLILVFLCLALFLDLRLAFWVTWGIPFAFLGCFALMPSFDVSVNMISLFAFIMVLGMVVDDAIVVGENIYEHRQQGMSPVAAAIAAVQEIWAPVMMAVLTTVVAFLPLLFVTGVVGKFMRSIPIVVVLVLLVSLMEALFILPAHLAALRIRPERRTRNPLTHFHRSAAHLFKRFVNGPFADLAMFCVRNRYATIAAAIAILLSTLGLMTGRFIKTTFMDTIEADNMVATLDMPQGTPPEQTLAVLKRLEETAFQVRDEIDAQRPGEPSIFKHMSTTIGAHPASEAGGPVQEVSVGTSVAHLGEVNVELLPSEERQGISAQALCNRWRQLMGEVPGVSSLTFLSEIHVAGDDIDIELSHTDFDQLLAAAEDLKLRLRDYEGVTDIRDNFEPGKAEIRLALTDAGRTLGLTLGDLARQVRQGFYGDEVQRIQRGKHDIRVMVRYPQDQRRSLADIETMRIRLPDGAEIPFATVAKVDYGRGYASIQRADRRRVVNVTADVDDTIANADEINASLEEELLPSLQTQYPELSWRFAGEKREMNESFGALKTAFPIALVAIFALLAAEFRSYIQPLIVMSAIPFGIVGAVLGHVILGWIMGVTYNIGFLSFFGIVALSGVVVNDSLIMIDLINSESRAGVPLSKVVRDSVTRRFRPIMLTTVTTFLGLAPMLVEKSLQARFLVPMAISLAFGVAFATMITLLLVPSLYMILEDVRNLAFKLRRKFSFAAPTQLPQTAPDPES
ncbi:MAG TPA: efflux RND transporter permease subunit [Anaerohalosphaeraceae bacterium]|nr:efflux RND transporter permease subunit [Anaerohalosphaeraceae bacterium]HRT50177.1 efflux RND transporter permease subunit [Anaerohalosphaeraceae bacterium]HRT86108.1 efflux RND transporter permease subunit [Anaerohalosphaeraceae bacterium]